MSRGENAFQLRQEAMWIQTEDPRMALDLLWAVAKKYPNSSTVRDYVVDDLIMTARLGAFWDDAIEACAVAQKAKPSFREHYVLEAQAFQLDKEGRHVEATEVRLKGSGGWYGDLRYFGDEFARLGAHDRAWRVYNQAAEAAVKDRQSPHSVRQAMAKLLLKEDKPDRAVEMIITGIYEAQKVTGKVPKSLLTDLRKALRAAGFNLRAEQYRGLADEIASVCTEKGKRHALKLFQAQNAQLKALG